MKKALMTLLALLTVGHFLWCDLQGHYKKGEIILKNVEGFGRGNDWESMFFERYKDIAVVPDGSVFVVNLRNHHIFKFDRNGKFIKKFGRRGRGPGDFVHPMSPSILDNKYLVVAEYATNRRLTVWDFNGSCKKVVKTNHMPFLLTALRDNHAAFYRINRHADKKNGHQRVVSVIIKNIVNGKEKIIKKVSCLDRSRIMFSKNVSGGIGNFFGQVFLAQTKDGNLAVGVSDRPGIEIYSPKGELLGTFNLKITPIPADEKYIKRFKDNYMAELNGKDESAMNRTQKFYHDLSKKKFRNFDFSTIFDKNLPLYNKIVVDSEGNLLVFKFTRCREDCHPVFQVYSSKGEYICETKLNTGEYHLEMDYYRDYIRFTPDGVIAFVSVRGDEDEDKTYRLIKATYPPGN